MAQIVVTQHTNLAAPDVITRAVHFFSNERWRVQSQSERIATFVGKPPIPWLMILLTALGFAMCIVPGVILWFMVIRKMFQLQNIVVTANAGAGGTEIVVTHAPQVTKLVQKFVASIAT